MLYTAVRAVTGVLDTENRDENIEGALKFLNTNEHIPLAVKEAVTDIVGESDVNREVYSLVKKVTAAVQRNRSMYQQGTESSVTGLFKTKPTKKQWMALQRSFAETDAGFLVHHVHGGSSRVMQLIINKAEYGRELSQAQVALVDNRLGDVDIVLREAEQLAEYMVTGKTGRDLSTNAEVIAIKAGIGIEGVDRADILNKIDKYVSLLALGKADHTVLSEMYNKEPEAILNLLDTQAAVTRNELNKVEADRRAGVKGYHVREARGQVVRIKADKRAEYHSIGYHFVQNDIDGYIYMVAGPFVTPKRQSGIIQSTRTTLSGFDTSKLTLDTWNTTEFEPETDIEDGYVPVYALDNTTVIGRVRAIPREVTDKIKHETNYAKSLGDQRGRQVEEVMVSQQNQGVLEALKRQYEKDLTRGRGNEYVNIFDPQPDPITQDAINALDLPLLKRLANGEPVMVRKDQLKTVVGYRYASVADFWTGNSRWSKETQRMVRDILETVLGPNARRYLTWLEGNWKDLIAEAKHVIVVKSVAIGVLNAVSNIVHLLTTGMSIRDVYTSVMYFAKESRIHNKAENRLMEIQHEKLLTHNKDQLAKLAAEEEALQETIKSLEIYPLIEAGELSGIVNDLTDTGNPDTVVGLLGSKYKDLRDNTGMLGKTLGNLTLTEDSTTYKWSRTFVDYGDFLAKAAVMRHWKSKGIYDKDTLLSRVREEFINYSIPPGRTRHSLESLGAIWFWQFKLGATKVALRRLTENPISAFMGLATATKLALPVGTVGIPLQDNIITQFIDGTLSYTMGLGMMESAVSKHPAMWLPNLMAR